MLRLQSVHAWAVSWSGNDTDLDDVDGNASGLNYVTVYDGALRVTMGIYAR